jgi:hypothetical protein
MVTTSSSPVRSYRVTLEIYADVRFAWHEGRA